MELISGAGGWLIALLYLAGLAGSAGTLLGFFGRIHWVLDLFSHFRVQYAALLAICALGFGLMLRPYEAAAAGVFAILNLFLIAPFYLKPPTARLTAAHASSTTYRVLVANVLQPNPHFSKVSDLIRAQAPDLVLLIEVNRTWMDALAPALESYPYRLGAPRDDHYGLALLSRIPCDFGEIRRFGSLPLPALVAKLNVDGTPLTVIGAHPPPPKGGEKTALRDQQLAGIAAYAAALTGPVMVLGDLNISPWSPVFQDFLRKSGLRDSRAGFGVQASWPVDLPLVRVPIDHALVSSGLRVQDLYLGSQTGSDHFPLIFEFSVEST